MYDVLPAYFRIAWDANESWESSAIVQRYNGGKDARGSANQLNLMLSSINVKAVVFADKYVLVGGIVVSEISAAETFLQTHIGKPIYTILSNALYLLSSYNISIESPTVFSVEISLREVIRP